MSDNVVKMAPRERLKVKRTFGSRPHCSHRVAMVDAHARILECEACKAQLDPYGFLQTIATEEDREGSRERAAGHLDALLAWFTGAGGTMTLAPDGRVKIKLPLPNGARCEFSTSGFEFGIHRIKYALDEALRRYNAGGVVGVEASRGLVE